MRKARFPLLFLAVSAAVLAPLVMDDFWTSLLIQILIYGLLALAIDLLVGHVGMFPMGHAAFFAAAAYATAMLETRLDQPTLIAAPAGVLAALLLAIVFGMAVRTKGVYFILVTLALGYVLWGISVSWSSFTGGDNGIGNVPYPRIGALAVESMTAYYYVALVVVAGCGLLYRVLTRSPFGLALRGIRESESRMRSLGYPVSAQKYCAFLLSGTLAGVAGVLYIYSNRFVSPVTASFHVSAEAALMAIVGGSGTIVGPFIGSAVTLGIKNYISAFVEQWMAVMGIVFIATVLWAPNGIMGIMARILKKAERTPARSPDSLPADVEGDHA